MITTGWYSTEHVTKPTSNQGAFGRNKISKSENSYGDVAHADKNRGR